MTEEYYIGQIFEEMYPVEAAEWCNTNKAMMVEIDPITKEAEEEYEEFETVVVPATDEEPEHTEQQIVTKTRMAEKTLRRFEIQAIPSHVPTYEEQKERRASAYQAEVDPITSHIQRLRDKEQTEEVIAEINELIVERDARVEEIKERYPYPDGEE